jgi:hypothetical protein
MPPRDAVHLPEFPDQMGLIVKSQLLADVEHVRAPAEQLLGLGDPVLKMIGGGRRQVRFLEVPDHGEFIEPRYLLKLIQSQIIPQMTQYVIMDRFNGCARISG